MKEFQNWWEKEYSWRIDDVGYPCPEIYAEESWRAALEWIDEEINWFCLDCDFSELHNVIKEELKDD